MLHLTLRFWPKSSFMKTASLFGFCGVVILILVLALKLLASFASVSENTCRLNLRLIAIAQELYIQETGTALVSSANADGSGLSWRVRLLPYVIQEDCPKSVELLSDCPQQYRCVADSAASPDMTSYVAILPPDQKTWERFGVTEYPVSLGTEHRGSISPATCVPILELVRSDIPWKDNRDFTFWDVADTYWSEADRRECASRTHWPLCAAPDGEILDLKDYATPNDLFRRLYESRSGLRLTKGR